MCYFASLVVWCLFIAFVFPPPCPVLSCCCSPPSFPDLVGGAFHCIIHAIVSSRGIPDTEVHFSEFRSPSHLRSIPPDGILHFRSTPLPLKSISASTSPLRSIPAGRIPPDGDSPCASCYTKHHSHFGMHIILVDTVLIVLNHEGHTNTTVTHTLNMEHCFTTVYACLRIFTLLGGSSMPPSGEKRSSK